MLPFLKQRLAFAISYKHLATLAAAAAASHQKGKPVVPGVYSFVYRSVWARLACVYIMCVCVCVHPRRGAALQENFAFKFQICHRLKS